MCATVDMQNCALCCQNFIAASEREIGRRFQVELVGQHQNDIVKGCELTSIDADHPVSDPQARDLRRLAWKYVVDFVSLK